MNYISKLKNIIQQKKSNLVIGLDTDIKKIPKCFLKYDNPSYEFNKSIINATKDVVAGYKFNIAFYEAMKDNGFNVLEKSLKLIPFNCITICDAKRGDIANTNKLYSKIYFELLDFDAITLSPYMGAESISPFLSESNKFAYILALTSNQGSKDFQKLKILKKWLYEIIIEKFLAEYGVNKVGFVFGANHTNEIKKITNKNSDISLLIPGIGAQGNDLLKLIRKIGNDIFLVNSSRAIIYDNNINTSRKDFSKLIIKKTIDFNNAVNKSKIGEL